MHSQSPVDLKLRSQRLVRDAGGHNVWDVREEVESYSANELALVLCDVWDNHWSRGARERLEAMLPRMVETVNAARARGIWIVHAPSETMDFYSVSSARNRILAYPPAEPPEDRDHADPPLPIDDSDHGSDTDDEPARPWTRQHPAIPVDEVRDLISDSGREILSFIRVESIRRVLILGVHTNMCILNRSFAIKQMVRWGVPVALVRDLTDTMYNPSMPPYVDHDQGTQLVTGYIEKFWCPSLLSVDLIGSEGLV